MNISVLVDGQSQPVEISFGNCALLARLQRWRTRKRQARDPRVCDAMEFCRRASKRWLMYRKAHEAVTSLKELRAFIRKNPKGEAAFLLMAVARWHQPSKILGFCFCRRTWCHNIAVDFVAVHPSAIGGCHKSISGVGSGLFFSLSQMADRLGIKTIWGEATVNSAHFYEKMLGTKNVRDYFLIQGRARHKVRQHYHSTCRKHTPTL